MAKSANDKINGIGTDAVKLRTGKTWAEWLAILDAAGARAMTHKQIVAYLAEKHGVGPWWQQMVTVGYEKARAGRVQHQRTDGFEVGRSKTIAVPIADLFAAWKDKRKRSQWLKDAHFTIRKATTDRSLRVTWVDGQTWLDVGFLAKGPEKSQVSVSHLKLANQADVARMKVYWGEQLDRLQALLEK